MDLASIFGATIFAVVAILAIGAGVATLWSVLKRPERHGEAFPTVGRHIRLKTPKTRPLIAGQWERQIKPPRDED